MEIRTKSSSSIADSAPGRSPKRPCFLEADPIIDSPVELRRWIREVVKMVEQTRGMCDDETRNMRHSLIAELAIKRQLLAKLETGR